MNSDARQNSSQIATVLGRFIVELDGIVKTNDHLINHHAFILAQENQKNNGDSIGNVSQA